MKQVIENMNTGRVEVQDLPEPVVRSGGVLVRTRASLVSAGTERMMLKLGRKNLLGKARQRPDLVKKVLAKLPARRLPGHFPGRPRKARPRRAAGLQLVGRSGRGRA